MNITGILLAAGASTRFGSDKLLYQLNDKGPTIIEKSAQNLVAVINNIVIIIDPQNQALTQHLNTLQYPIIHNPLAKLGIGSSIACGVKATKHADAWLIALGDMPFIQAQSIQQVSRALGMKNKIIAPFFHGKRGHPVGFSKNYYTQLSVLTKDSGAHSIIKDHADNLIAIDLDDSGICMDIDRRCDLNC